MKPLDLDNLQQNHKNETESNDNRNDDIKWKSMKPNKRKTVGSQSVRRERAE